MFVIWLKVLVELDRDGTSTPEGCVGWTEMFERQETSVPLAE